MRYSQCGSITVYCDTISVCVGGVEEMIYMIWLSLWPHDRINCKLIHFKYCKYEITCSKCLWTDSRFVPSQWEAALLCNDVSHWLGASLESALWLNLDHYTDVSNHQPHCFLLNRLFTCRSKKTSKVRVTGLGVGNSPGPVNSPHKGPVTRKMFPFDDVIMFWYELQ